MANQHGDFVWYELATKDVAAAQAFYGPLMGWDFAEGADPAMAYHLISKDGEMVAGMMALTEDMTAKGAQPMWAGYIEVDDVDATLAKATGLGAVTYVEPTDIPDQGRFAMLADPQGASFYMMASLSDEESHSFSKHERRAGHCAWNELVTSDPAAAQAFYTDLFGWEKTAEIEMEGIGLYEMFSVNGYGLGAMMPKPAEVPASGWAYYMRVDDIDAAARFTRDNGGQIVQDLMEIPDGDFTLQAFDPQGAFFSLIGKSAG